MTNNRFAGGAGAMIPLRPGLLNALEVSVDHPLLVPLVREAAECLVPRGEPTGVTIAQELVRGQGDQTPSVGVSLGRGRGGAAAMELGSLDLRLFGTPAYLNKSGWQGELSTFTRHPLAVLDFFQRPSVWGLHDDGATWQVMVPAGVRYFERPSDILVFALQHQGLAWFPARIAHDGLAAGLLVDVLGPWRLPTPPVQVTLGRGLAEDGRAQSLVAAMREVVAGFNRPVRAAA